MNFENSYAVIMAGGIGSRFWPKSRESKPKQFLSLVDDGSLIQNTAARLKGLFRDDQICIVSTAGQRQLIYEQLPWIPEQQLYFEPMGRNTAPAIGIAAVQLLAQNPNAEMVVLPADHRITQTNVFLENIKTALTMISKDDKALVTIGIDPSYAATGYGYIEASTTETEIDVFAVNRFTEKPDRDTAKKFLSSGRFFWNSGIFIWRAKTILAEFRKHMPDWYTGLIEIQTAIGSPDYDAVVKAVYDRLEGTSVDYGIMEHAKNVHMVRGRFGWSDLGTWEEVYNISEKDENNNVIKGHALLKDVKNSYIQTSNRTASIIGLKDIIVIDEPDALLICNKDHSQDVRWIASKIDQNHGA